MRGSGGTSPEVRMVGTRSGLAGICWLEEATRKKFHAWQSFWSFGEWDCRVSQIFRTEEGSWLRVSLTSMWLWCQPRGSPGSHGALGHSRWHQPRWSPRVSSTVRSHSDSSQSWKYCGVLFPRSLCVEHTPSRQRHQFHQECSVLLRRPSPRETTA